MMRRESFDEGIRVMAAVAVLRRGKILLIREREEPYRGLWVLPQGYVKRGETVSEAARREVREEIGVGDVQLEGLVGVYDDLVRVGSQEGLVHCVIVCYLGRITGSTEPRSTVEAIDSAWVDPKADLPQRPAVVRKMMADIENVARRRRRW